MKDMNVQMRDAFISRLFEKAKQDSNIIFVSNEQGAMALDSYRNELPNQFINAGISEQNIISMAAGLAYSGMRVIVYSIATFITLRCLEQIKIDLCVMKLPVTIVGVGTCYSYSTDGPTHHATEDISIMRSLSNMQIFSPSDSFTASLLADYAIKTTHPTYIRLDREKLPIINSNQTSINSGFSTFEEGFDVCIVATGIMVHRAIEVSKELRKKSISAKVIDLYKLKPINSMDILCELQKSKKIITLEEHTINGGIGSIISELLSDNKVLMPLIRIAVYDNDLYDYGERNILHKSKNLDKSSIIEKILNN